MQKEHSSCFQSCDLRGKTLIEILSPSLSLFPAVQVAVPACSCPCCPSCALHSAGQSPQSHHQLCKIAQDITGGYCWIWWLFSCCGILPIWQRHDKFASQHALRWIILFRKCLQGWFGEKNPLKILFLLCFSH